MKTILIISFNAHKGDILFLLNLLLKSYTVGAWKECWLLELTLFCLLIQHIFIDYFVGLWGYCSEQDAFCYTEAYKLLEKIYTKPVIQLPRYDCHKNSEWEL